ncbi:glycoside hydrolase family 2 protein [Candidatus Chloroploca sp. Khr17]|uniref:glycoside hydrolase family 2 protein n=1 Tax=Candidatus Chloroploca sp. Khr17 TaxID=2496869 RepID=UPI00101C5E9D|nr:glycoside hydrolase family 2 TIM barrel-domain containing protein [Candidatus Chloroploca sp. Khr17]
MYDQTLADHWQIHPIDTFRQGIYPRDDEGWFPAHVPAHWQQLSGFEHYAGRVVYRCRFLWSDAEAADQALRRRWLRLKGVFYHSRVYLNGVDLGAHTGYFEPHEREITGLLQRENTLLVEVECPDERNKSGKTMITGVFSHWDCLDPQANPGGIWLPVELHHSRAVHLARGRLLTLTCNDRFAQIRFDLEVDAATACDATVRLTFTPRTFAGEAQQIEQQRSLGHGPQQLGGLIKLREPRLWWTHDLGRPDLYDVTVEVLVDGHVSDLLPITFGVRTFELRNWLPYLNGERFLVKGNNYPPGDMRIATMDKARCAADLELARDCHMNMLRVHAHVDHPAFYEAANEAGILLWQDFPLQWLYASSILEEARRQVRVMVHQLGSHPSVAIWCMHNESFLIEDTADESIWTRIKMQLSVFGPNWNRNVMDTQLKALVEQEDPTRPVVRSSGELDITYLREGTDGHAYFGWYRNYGDLRDAEVMQKRFPNNMRFMTEFGSQSFPNLESSLRFMPDPLTDEAIAQLATRHGLQAEIMDNWIPWRQAGSLANVIKLSQDYQIFINRYYIDRLRNNKYRPTGGIIAFLLLDPYPAVLWSVVDYWRVPKRSYEAMRMAFSPQYAYCVFEPRLYSIGEAITLALSVVNDARRGIVGAQVAARLSDPGGNVLAEVRHRVNLPADCLPIVVDRLRLTPTQAGRYALTIELTGVDHAIHQIYEIAVG